MCFVDVSTGPELAEQGDNQQCGQACNVDQGGWVDDDQGRENQIRNDNR